MRVFTPPSWGWVNGTGCTETPITGSQHLAETRDRQGGRFSSPRTACPGGAAVTGQHGDMWERRRRAPCASRGKSFSETNSKELQRGWGLWREWVFCCFSDHRTCGCQWQRGWARQPQETGWSGDRSQSKWRKWEEVSFDNPRDTVYRDIIPHDLLLSPRVPAPLRYMWRLFIHSWIASAWPAACHLTVGAQ